MDFAAVLLCILVIAWFFTTVLKANSASMPLFTFCAVILFFIFTGMAGLLRWSFWIVYAFAVFAAVYIFVLKRKDIKLNLKVFFTPGLVFFILASVFFYVALRIRQPYFVHWDEFSFWGPACKLIYSNRQLYTLVDSSIISNSYQPFLPMANFFIQGLSPSFCEWKVYLAYDMIMMACMACMFGGIKWKNPVSLIVCTVFALSCIYTFWYGTEGTYMYITSYSDVPLGVFFGGAILMHFHNENTGFGKYIPTAVILATLPMVKDMGFAFGFIAAAVILIDSFISTNGPVSLEQKGRQRLTNLGFSLLLFLIVFLSYQSWNWHFTAVSDTTRAIRPYEYSMLQIFTGKDPFFNDLFLEMNEMLSKQQLAVFGTIKEMLILFTAIPLVFVAFLKDNNRRIRLAVLALMMCAGFFVYYYFLCYCYTATMPHSLRLVSYNRYVSSYTIGWIVMLGGVMFSDLAQLRFEKFKLVSGIISVSLLFCLYAYYCPVNADQYFFISPKITQRIGLSDLRKQMYTQTSSYTDLTVEDRFYVVDQHSEGGETFIFNYQMMPAYTVSGIGAGNFVAPGTTGIYGIYDTEVTRQQFADYLVEQDVDLVYVLAIDDYFISEFSDLFTDRLSAFLGSQASMYFVINDNGNVTLTPCGGGAHYRKLQVQYYG